jgi:hypothetical protein
MKKLMFYYPKIKQYGGQNVIVEEGEPFVLYLRKDSNIQVRPHEDAPDKCCRIAIEGLGSGYAVMGKMGVIMQQIEEFRGDL